MNILAIPVQSISDLITNSSSEVFILDTGKTCEEVNDILKGFTSGFAYPEVFSLKDFREWRKKLRNGEVEDDWSYPGSIFSIANGWFKDPEDEEDLLNLRMDFLFDPFETIDYGDGLIAHGYSSSYKEPIHDAFIEHLNSNWDKVRHNINLVLAEEGDDAVSIYYHVLLPLMPSGRSNKGIEPGVFEYLEDVIQEHDIKNAAFGAHFVEYLKTSKIKTHLYPPESLSKNVILTKDKVQITPSSFNLNPIMTINL